MAKLRNLVMVTLLVFSGFINPNTWEATGAVPPRKIGSGNGCTAEDCDGGNDVNASAQKWRMPLVTLGAKGYYIGIFFKANWFRAYQFCRYHGLHLVSIESQEENVRLEEYIKSEGLMGEHFWTSGTDQAEEGNFFWMGTGRPLTYTNWNAGEPNNFKYENNEEEHCLELWNRDGRGLKWNDTPCSFETYFVCERVDEMM